MASTLLHRAYVHGGDYGAAVTLLGIAKDSSGQALRQLCHFWPLTGAAIDH
jgi:hypothetical protein